MSKDKLLDSIGQIHPTYIENAEKQVLVTRIKPRSWKKYMALTASAALFSLVILGFSFPSYASQIPIIGGIFEIFDRNEDMDTGRLQGFAQEINLTGKIGGMPFTIEEAVFDGQVLYFSYVIESQVELGEWEALFNVRNLTFHVGREDILRNMGWGAGGGPLQQLAENTYIGVWSIMLPPLSVEVESGTIGFILESEFGSGCFQVSFPVERVNNIETSFVETTMANSDFAATLEDMRVSPLGTTIYFSYQILNERYLGYISEDMILNSGTREFSVATLNIKVYDELGNEYTLGMGSSEVEEYGRNTIGWIQFIQPVHEDANTLIVTLSMTIAYWNLGDWQDDGSEEHISQEAIITAGGSVETSEIILGTIQIDIMRD